MVEYRMLEPPPATQALEEPQAMAAKVKGPPPGSVAVAGEPHEPAVSTRMAAVSASRKTVEEAAATSTKEKEPTDA